MAFPGTRSHRCPGQYYDQESGPHYNLHRYYEPGIGRYMRADPIRLNGGVNLYVYVQNDPVNMPDPTGLVCGSGWNEYIVPDRSAGFDFTAACRWHDDCYRRCSV